MVILCVMCGCATTGRYGSFVHDPNLDQKKLGLEAARQLAIMYPPAKTLFVMRQATPDPFGSALLDGLCEQGFALMEFSDKQTQKGTGGVPLNYVLDSVEGGLYRLTLHVGSQSIARPFVAPATPVGYWVNRAG